MRLVDAWPGHRSPHLVTVDGGRAHVAPVAVTVADGALRVSGAGRRSTANAAARAEVTLVWSPVDDGGHSLIVDGVADVDADGITVRPLRAVRHRPGTPPDGGGPGCAGDCVELDPGL